RRADHKRLSRMKRGLEATGRSYGQTNTVDRVPLLERLGAQREQQLERVISRAVVAQPERDRAAQLVELETLQVFTEHIPNVVLQRAVEPHPDGPRVRSARDDRAAIDQPVFQKAAHG